MNVKLMEEFMANGIVRSVLIFLLISIEVFSQDAGKVPILISNLTSVNFEQKGEISELELLFDTNEVKANKFHVSQDKQVVIDLKNVQSTERVMRGFDASEFSGPVVFISAYKKPGTKNDIRVTLQLRDNVRSVLKRRTNRIVLELENRFGVFNQQEVIDHKKFEKKTEVEAGDLARLLIPKSSSVEDILENLTLSGRKKYIGDRISLEVKDVAVSDILKMIAEASGFNIILTDEVKSLPPLTLNLTNIPWDQALDTVLGLNKLVANKNGIILMVQSLVSATNDKKKEEEAKLLSRKQEPIVTKVFLISYAKTKDLMTIIKEYLTKDRGSVAEDERTNSLIIKDTPDVIERIRKIVEVLDAQTPQVLIESKVVEVNEGYSKEIGLQQGLNFGYDPVGSIGTSSATTVGDDQTSSIDGGPGFSFSTAPSDGDSARNIFGFAITRFSRLTNLNFDLQLMETESKGKVISSPKIVTQNKKKATLIASKTDSFVKIEGVGDQAQRSSEEVEAKVQLEVTPQVTNEGSIILEIGLIKEDFGDRPFEGAAPRKLSSDIKTNVLVENGSTIVLGGLYEYQKRESHSGVPFLKDIPLVGWLFRTAYAPNYSKREVIIFITPRIINQAEAGLINERDNG